jgi:hypothetical protein
MPYEKIRPSKRCVTPFVSLVQIASLATFWADTWILVKEPIEGQDLIISQILFVALRKNRDPILRYEHAGKLFS